MSATRERRVGNGAFDQSQNDVYGAARDSILLHTRRSERLPRRLWPIVEAQAECARRVWREPDQGIWEARGKPQHYVSSKPVCWVAMDRGNFPQAFSHLALIEASARIILDERLQEWTS